MRGYFRMIRTVLVLAGLAMICCQSSVVFGQTAAAGVVVSADNVLQTKVYSDPGGHLSRERIAAAKASLPQDVATASRMRCVSLKHLEQTITEKNGAIDPTMRYLAGLLRVKYVFYYPDSQDIVLAGPAEGWMTDLSGRVVGLTSGRPVVQLQDLAVALRAFRPNEESPHVIGCSIDPTKEGLAAMQQFLRQMGTQLGDRSQGQAKAQFIVENLKASLGLQRVTVNGVSPKTNFARIMVEADYRMKLIGIGLEQPPVKMASFVDRANPGQVSRNALCRWFFVPDYQCVRVSEDGLAMQLVGDGVKLVGEDEMVSTTGQRQVVGSGNRASQEFTTAFTKNYGRLADRAPVYAELRNVVDLAVVSAYIKEQNLYKKADWKAPVLGDESTLAVETLTAPKMVESAVTAVFRGNSLMTPIGGGVHIEAQQALAKENRLSDDKGAVAKARQTVKLDLKPGQWWWDNKE